MRTLALFPDASGEVAYRMPFPEAAASPPPSRRLDEPTTGLHPSDVVRLLAQFNRLVGHRNTVIVVERDLDIIASSDWRIDMGPGAGKEGGNSVAAGS